MNVNDVPIDELAAETVVKFGKPIDDDDDDDDEGAVVSIVGFSNAIKGLNVLHRLSVANGGSVGTTKRSFTKCFGAADVVFFCDLFGLYGVSVWPEIILPLSVDCVIVVVFVVAFDVVIAFEFFVRENVNGVSATSDLDSIKFLG